MNDLDFSGQTVLVVGGSSGIGNGVAQTFRTRGAQVHIWGTRAQAGDYAAEEGSDLTGLTYAQVDVSNLAAIEAAPAPDRLDVLCWRRARSSTGAASSRWKAFARSCRSTSTA